MADLGQGVATESIVNSTCPERGESSDRTERHFPGANVVPSSFRGMVLVLLAKAAMRQGRAPRESTIGLMYRWLFGGRMPD